ncbi:MAG: 3-oxoacyl-[acyl-carrier protein] reductase, partial [Kiritimatiellia bacterium]
MHLDLTGRTALVTGASGGIGWALVEAFVAEGCQVIALAHRNLDALNRAVDSAGMADQVRCYRADITQPDDLEQVFDALSERGIVVSLLVANAGVWPNADEPLHRASVDRIRDTIDVNLMGSIWTVRAWMKHLAAHE